MLTINDLDLRQEILSSNMAHIAGGMPMCMGPCGVLGVSDKVASAASAVVDGAEAVISGAYQVASFISTVLTFIPK
jgi:hypothetical protein